MSYQALIWLLHCAKSMLLTRDLEKSHTKANWKRCAVSQEKLAKNINFFRMALVSEE